MQSTWKKEINPIFYTKFEGVGHTFRHCTCEVVYDGRLVHILLNVLYDNYESFFQILGGSRWTPSFESKLSRKFMQEEQRKKAKK